MKWISVKEGLPKEEIHVLLYDESEEICVGYLRSDYFNHHPMGDYASCALLYHITHWMPLPEKPK